MKQLDSTTMILLGALVVLLLFRQRLAALFAPAVPPVEPALSPAAGRPAVLPVWKPSTTDLRVNSVAWGNPSAWKTEPATAGLTPSTTGWTTTSNPLAGAGAAVNIKRPIGSAPLSAPPPNPFASWVSGSTPTGSGAGHGWLP